MQLGMVGLGRMGSGMTKRLEQHGHEIKSYDPKGPLDGEDAAGAREAARRAAPRLADGAVREDHGGHVPEARRVLEPGDTIVDGGNSNFRDSQRRYAEARKAKLRFVDVGVSGGIWGLEVGFCLMAGGDKGPVRRLQPIFEALAPEDGWAHVGSSGAGHFTKMVHNGIEYGLMQSYAEGFELMNQSEFELDLSEIAGIWRYGSVVRSWLLELLHEALEQYGDGLDEIAPYVEDSGEVAGRSTPRSTARPRCRRSRRRSTAASLRAERSTSRPSPGRASATSSAVTRSGGKQEKRRPGEHGGGQPSARGLAAPPHPRPVRARDLRRLGRPDPAQALSRALLARGSGPAARALRHRRRRAHRADDEAVRRGHEEGGRRARPRRARRRRLGRPRRGGATSRPTSPTTAARTPSSTRFASWTRSAARAATASTTSPCRRWPSRRS